MAARKGITPATASPVPYFPNPQHQETHMGRSILLWLLGVPIPIIILLALFWH
jgi:hypothetical protein